VGIILNTLQFGSLMGKRALPRGVEVAGSRRPIVEATDACVHYGSVVALAPSSLTIESGTSTALVGPNGSGKSTLLGLLAGLVRPTAGTVAQAPGVRVAFVGQQQHQHRWMPLSVEDVLRMGRYAERGLLRRLRPSDHTAIAASARRLDVADLRHRPFGELSGGQRQRVLVAQALAASPGLLLLDEPITGLDLASQERILEIIASEAAAGTAVVISTHHLGEARRTDRVVLLAGCVIADGAPGEVLRPELLSEAFGNRLITSGAAALVVDEHGHAHDDCPDGEPDAAALLPQHHHDHHAHIHRGMAE
jgi:zinc/manganese transport system ATP-binding protein